MANNTTGTLSFIILLLSIILFFLPAFAGSSILIFSFIFSFALLVIAFFVSIVGLNVKSGENSGLALSSLIISIIFLLFLIIAALIQVSS